MQRDNIRNYYFANSKKLVDLVMIIFAKTTLKD